MIKSWCYNYRLTAAESDSRPDEMDRNSCEWAQLVVTENGMFAVTSDYGDYVYRWPWGGYSCNQGCFRKFLLGVGNDYLLSKIAKQTVLQINQTVREVKREIIRCRRHGNFTQDQARSEWELIHDVVDESDRE